MTITQSSMPLAATVDGLVQTLIVTVLLTIVPEQRRKRAIRRTLELAFLNHHVRNALTQMTMISYIADPERQERLPPPAFRKSCSESRTTRI